MARVHPQWWTVRELLDSGRLGALRLVYDRVMSADGGLFRPDDVLTRAELGRALMLGARVPQYVPNTPSFIDVQDPTTMNFAEGAQSLFPDAVRGSTFRPDDRATRLVAAVVLVRAAGLRAEAESKAGVFLPYTDAASIPYDLRGYVQVAVSYGLMSSAQQFNPPGALTRAELARGVSTILQMNMVPDAPASIVP